MSWGTPKGWGSSGKKTAAPVKKRQSNMPYTSGVGLPSNRGGTGGGGMSSSSGARAASTKISTNKGQAGMQGWGGAHAGNASGAGAWNTGGGLGGKNGMFGGGMPWGPRGKSATAQPWTKSPPRAGTHPSESGGSSGGGGGGGSGGGGGGGGGGGRPTPAPFVKPLGALDLKAASFAGAKAPAQASYTIKQNAPTHLNLAQVGATSSVGTAPTIKPGHTATPSAPVGGYSPADPNRPSTQGPSSPATPTLPTPGNVSIGPLRPYMPGRGFNINA